MKDYIIWLNYKHICDLEFTIYTHIVYTYRQAFKNAKSLFLLPVSPKALKGIRRGAGEMT